jgi:nucleotide-binding universal stress UspA family protein
MSEANHALTIVVGYDGSDAARRGLARVRGLGESASKVLVVAVAPDVRSAGLGAQLVGGMADTRRLLDEALDLLDPPKGMEVEVREVAGDPAVILIDIARESAADLLVIGRRGADFVARALLGSVAERAVQGAPCDVLVVA